MAALTAGPAALGARAAAAPPFAVAESAGERRVGPGHLDPGMGR